MGIKPETLNAGKTKIHIMSTNKHIKFVWAFYLSKAKIKNFDSKTTDLINKWMFYFELPVVIQFYDFGN